MNYSTACFYLLIVKNFLLGTIEPSKIFLMYNEGPGNDEYQLRLMQNHELARRAFKAGFNVCIDDVGVLGRHGNPIYTRIFDLKSLVDVLTSRGIEREKILEAIEPRQEVQ